VAELLAGVTPRRAELLAVTLAGPSSSPSPSPGPSSSTWPSSSPGSPSPGRCDARLSPWFAGVSACHM